MPQGVGSKQKGKLLEGRASKSRVLQLTAASNMVAQCVRWAASITSQPQQLLFLVFYLFEVVFQGSNNQGGQGCFLDHCKNLQFLGKDSRTVKVYVFWAGVFKAREHVHIHISMMPCW